MRLAPLSMDWLSSDASPVGAMGFKSKLCKSLQWAPYKASLEHHMQDTGVCCCPKPSNPLDPRTISSLACASVRVKAQTHLLDLHESRVEEANRELLLVRSSGLGFWA